MGDCDRGGGGRRPQCDTKFPGRFDESGREITVVCTKLGPDLGLTNGTRIRWLAVETGGSPLVVAIEGWTRSDYERVLAPAQRVLDGLRISR